MPAAIVLCLLAFVLCCFVLSYTLRQFEWNNVHQKLLHSWIWIEYWHQCNQGHCALFCILREILNITKCSGTFLLRACCGHLYVADTILWNRSYSNMVTFLENKPLYSSHLCIADTDCGSVDVCHREVPLCTNFLICTYTRPSITIFDLSYLYKI